MQPLWQGSGGVPQDFLLFPLPSRKGVRGMVRASIEAQPPQAGSPEGCNPFGRGLGVSPRTSYYSPFLSGRGSGGWSEPQLKRSPRRRGGGGESRGVQPLWQGSGGVPQDFLLFPLPSRKGARGMVLATIEAKPPIAGVQQDAWPPHPRLLRRSTPRKDGPYFSLCHARLTRAPRRRE